VQLDRVRRDAALPVKEVEEADARDCCLGAASVLREGGSNADAGSEDDSKSRMF
jgi:hypothetical protein